MRLFSVSSLAAAMLPALSSAQTSPESPAIEGVVVTAQRREEKLQDVPVAVTALTAEQLETRGVTSIDSLNALAPNLQVSYTPGNSTSAQLAIRGGVTVNPALTWEPTVGVYLDGVYIGKTQGSIFDIVDLERVEVLRGPQGTLYGRNTLAGALNMVTRAPTGELSGSANVAVGNYNYRQGRLSLDLPKWGIASVGIGLRSAVRDGWIDVRPPANPSLSNPTSVDDLNDLNTAGARLAVRLEFSDSITGDYRYDYSDADQNSAHSQLTRADTAFFSSFAGIPVVGPKIASVLDYVSQERQETASIDAGAFEQSTVQGHSFTLDWEASDVLTVKSISAYRQLEWDDSLDLDGSPVNVAHTSRLSDYDALSQELQLLGDHGGLRYVAGLYYFEDDGATNNPLLFFGEFGGPPIDSRFSFTTRAWSAFAQVDYELTDRLTVTGGLRYTDERKSLERFYNDVATANTFSAAADKTFSDVTPLAIVAYQVSDAVNLYAKYSSGFKSGGFNGEAVSAAEVRMPFDAETIQAIELGAKSTLAQGRAILNIAAFENRHDDMQLSVFVGTAAASVVRNAGKATIRGFEVEGMFQPFDALKVGVAYGYLDPEYDEYFEDVGSPPMRRNVANNRVFPHTPEHTFSANLEAKLAEASYGVWRAFLDYSYTDEYYLYPYAIVPETPATQQRADDTLIKSYSLVNARLQLGDISLGGAELAATLWAKNLLDKEYVANRIDFGPTFGNLTQSYFGMPRTYALELTARWR
jgi:iron complex outermembrane receptor protein